MHLQIYDFTGQASYLNHAKICYQCTGAKSLIYRIYNILANYVQANAKKPR